MYYYVLFDLDGTVTDSFEGITNCVCYALDSFGIHISDKTELACFIGPPLFEQFKFFAKFNDREAEKAVKKYRERYSVTGWKKCKLAEGTEELLQNLKKRGKTVALATCKPEKYAKMILDYFNISEYFDFIGGAELDIKGRIDKYDVIDYVISNLKINKINRSKTVMVGDTFYDIDGAKSAGIASIGVLFGYGTKEELVAHGADYTVNNMREIINII